MRTYIPLLLLAAAAARGQELKPLDGTQPFTQRGDISAQMVEGIDRWLDRATAQTADDRNGAWRRAATGKEWESFVEAHREKLRQILGAKDARTPGTLEEIGESGDGLPDVTGNGFTVRRVRWPIFEGVNGEGLLFRPAAPPRATIIVVPDADETPEQCAMAQRLALQGCLVLVPVLVDRSDKWSGNDAVQRSTNQPGREWIYRQAFELGRTIIGYEAQKIFAAVDALTAPDSTLRAPAILGIAGYGEGGLLALHCAALDARFQAAMVSGYFGPRENLYVEPIYRNLFGFLKEFGDAELAAMIAPRRLIVEYSSEPEINGPPKPSAARTGAAPGVIRTPAISEVESEIARANWFRAGSNQGEFAALFSGPNGQPGPAGSRPALEAFLRALNVPPTDASQQETVPIAASQPFVDERQRRTVRELERFTQSLVRMHERARNDAVWSKAKPGADWDAVRRELQTRLWEQCIGKLPPNRLPPNPQTRIIREAPKWVGYEVRLDVMPDVFAWGWLLIPRDIKPRERRPVIVCQHGLEGLPEDTVNDTPPANAIYKAFAARLADQGFVVYAPHNPYRGGDKFRTLQRKANPLGLSLFSFIIAQHEAATEWLAGLPFVDPDRIAFYGLSYGGKTAMRVPAMIDRYCLSICSGDFNEWIYKVVSPEYRDSYMFGGEYEMSEWNLAAVANHAEMAMLIAPRPFMVERGHNDRCATDELVGYEFAKVLRGYTKLGIPDRAEIEWFDGPHTIHGAGTFEFLHNHLGWPGGK